MRLGIFDPPELQPWKNTSFEKMCSPEHKELAYQAALQSTVLLQNRELKETGSKVLPLDIEKINKETLSENETLAIQIHIKNIGSSDGDEVIQVYVVEKNRTDKNPIKHLKDFKRVSISKGKSSSVSLNIPIRELS